MTAGTTGPHGSLFATTPYGTYSIREDWQDRHTPRLSDLTDFLVGFGKPDQWGRTLAILRALVDAAGADREQLRVAHPREDAALYHWQGLSPLYPIRDAHGPTMRQLLDALNEANPVDDGSEL